MKYPKLTVSENPNIGTTPDDQVIPGGKGSEKLYLGLPYTHTHAGQNVVVHGQPQIPFRPKRLVVAPECAPFFQIHDIRMGAVSLLPSQGPAPASCFPPLPLDEDAREFLKYLEQMLTMHLGTCQVSQSISVHVTNVSKSDQIFKGMFWGDALYERR